MGELLAVLTGIGLLDSTSMVPLSIVPLAVTLGSRRPLLSSVAFIAGVFVVYLATGILLTLGLASAFDRINEAAKQKWQDPDTLDLLLQIVLGVIMMALGWRIADTRESQGDRGVTPEVSPGQVFVFAAGLTLAGIPGAVPYFAAIDQILRADPPIGGMLGALLYYNAIFTAPLMAIVFLRLVIGSRADRVLEWLQTFFERWGRRAIILILMLLGAALVADGFAWMFGRPLLPT